MPAPWTSLPIEVHRNDETGFYEFGVWLDGAFVVFGTKKTGGIDDDIQRVKDELEHERLVQAAAQLPPPESSPPVA